MPKMEISLIKKLAESLEFTKDTVGNTLRENAFLACLKCYIKYNLQNDPLDDPITVDEMDEFLSYE